MNDEKYQTEIPNIEYWKKMIECQYACPVDTRCGSYVNDIADGNYLHAYDLARGPNPFAALCGLICNHPCEQSCRRGSVDEPISIRALKRSAVEAFMQATNSDIRKSAKLSTAFGNLVGMPTGKKVAVVGSGPAGMAGAHDLACLGYRVTVFESLPIAGGMFYIGIPAYRLPRDTIKFDIDSILSLGIDIRLNTKVGTDITLQELFDEGFEAVMIAVGAQLSKPLPITGTNLKGVLKGISFLRNASFGKRPELGKRVIVIGGGDVAMDVAGTVRRFNIEDVHVVCLEAMDEMPATKIEKLESLEIGIVFHNRKGPQNIIGKNGKVTGLQVIDVASVFDDSGRFNPQFIEGSESIIEAETVITAIGQASDTACLKGFTDFKATRWGTIVTDEALNVGIPRVFAAGDIQTGPGVVIGAEASGQKAAVSIDEYLRGKKRKTNKRVTWTDLKDHSMPENYFPTKREEPPTIDPAERLKGFDLVEKSYPKEMAAEQSERCLKCNVNTIFYGDKCIVCGGCIDICPMKCLKLTDLSSLEGGEDLDKLIQNNYNISKSDYEKNKEEILLSLDGAAIIKDEEKCIRCALCAKRCPTDTITMERFYFEEVLINDESK